MRSDATVELPAGWGCLDYQGGLLLMRNETLIERGFRLQACSKEPWTAAWLKRLRPGDRLFNVGACVGSYTLIAAHRGADVVAVEANPTNAARLAQNVAANGLGERVTLVLGACGPSEVAQGAWLPTFKAGTADVKLGKPHAKGVQLPGVTLDGLADHLGRPTHLLIDVDGGERDVLRGGAEALAGVKEVLIEVSKDPTIAKECTALLAAAGLHEVCRWETRGGVEIQDVWYGLFRRV